MLLPATSRIEGFACAFLGAYLFFLPLAFATPARVATDLPACLAAVPAAFAAPAAPLAAPFAALLASLAADAAVLPCRVDAARLPPACELARCWLRFRVAAAFFAAAERSAFVCATLVLPSDRCACRLLMPTPAGVAENPASG
jgi:hypothetical protein